MVTVALVLGLLAFDVWLFAIHGLADGLRTALYNPELLLAVLASVVVATAFHEFGHASACRYSGGRPGVMGVGFYLVYPAFYCDVTDAYRLSRAGRLRTDLGGVYFNGIFALLAGGVFFATGQEAALLAAAVQHLILLQQLLPLMRFDGYYVLTDLTGVPDILSRIKPIFRSLVRGRDHEPQVAELKPWVRVVVTAYLLTLVPTLSFLFVWMVMGAPRILATVYDSFGLQLDRFQGAVGLADAGVAAVGILALVLPVVAMTLSLTRVGRLAGRGLVRWARGSVRRTVAATILAAAVIGAVTYIWWPNGDYEPIRPGERGTIGEVLEALPYAPGGRPFFTPADAVEYAGVPTAPAAVREETTPPTEPASPLRRAPFYAPDRHVVGDDPSPDGPEEAGPDAGDASADATGGETSGGEATPSSTEGTTSEPTPTPAPSETEENTTDTTAPATTPPPTAPTGTTDTSTEPEPTTAEPTPAPTTPTEDTSTTTTTTTP